jgi:hypothetical protein
LGHSHPAVELGVGLVVEHQVQLANKPLLQVVPALQQLLIPIHAVQKRLRILPLPFQVVAQVAVVQAVAVRAVLLVEELAEQLIFLLASITIW